MPFPVSEPPGELEEIRVRPESQEVWATVRSVHRFEGSRLRVKQFVHDLFWDMCRVKNLIRHREDGGVEGYGPIVGFPAGSQWGLHGTDYDGKEAGSLVRFMVQMESRVVEGRLGPEGMRRFLGRMRPAVDDRTLAIADRRFPTWSWSMRLGGKPWWSEDADTSREVGQLGWRLEAGNARRTFGVPLQLPEIPGHRIEAVGTYANRSQNHEECGLLYRSEDLHRAVEVRFVRRGSQRTAAYPEGLAAPLYRVEDWEEEGLHWRRCESRTLMSRRVLVDGPGGRLSLVFPPAASYDPADDRDTTRRFLDALPVRG